MDRRRTIDVITMGCSKNLVDSERLIRLLELNGYEVHHNPESLSGGDVVINTCGFIGDAKQESIDMILECCQAKKQHKAGKVYVMGCLSERYARELPTEIPEVDAWYGKFNWPDLIRDLHADSPATALWDRSLTTPPHYAYIKIAEGCNRFCAFCAIPLITGRYKSRPIDEIVAEVKALTERGVKEFNLIAQDLTAYGTDLYGKTSIAAMVEAIAQTEGVEWIRLHYAYPKDFPMDLLDVMAKYPNVCKYLDIALQHISDNVLDNMRRHITGEETRQLLREIRAAVPGIHIRTTLMVGFPGEGEAEFEELKQFVREARFERMGAFAYCEEDDTYAARNLSDDIPQEVKDARLQQLMDIQQEISHDVNLEKVGQTLRVIIDSENEDYYIGRTEFDSPEVDPEVLIEKTEKLERGQFYDVEITSAMPFELFGRPVKTVES